MRFDEVFGLWQEGERRLRAADPADRQAMERAVDVVVDALRRRLGGPFTADELAALYSSDGTDWAFELTTRAIPGNPGAWDMSAIGGTAFARYAREASDYRTQLALAEEEEE